MTVGGPRGGQPNALVSCGSGGVIHGGTCHKTDAKQKNPTEGCACQQTSVWVVHSGCRYQSHGAGPGSRRGAQLGNSRHYPYPYLDPRAGLGQRGSDTMKSNSHSTQTLMRRMSENQLHTSNAKDRTAMRDLLVRHHSPARANGLRQHSGKRYMKDNGFHGVHTFLSRPGPGSR